MADNFEKFASDAEKAAEAAAQRGGIGHPMSEKPPSFLHQKPRPIAAQPSAQGQLRDTRDIRELAQQIDGLMFEIIERLQNLNGWLGQLPRVK